MPIVNIPDDSLLVFDYNGSLWQILKGEGDSNAVGITDENNDEWYIDAGDGNTYDLQIQASDDVTKTWFLALGVNMSELIGNPIVIGDSSGIDTSDATAAAGDILSGKTAYVDGEKITGTIATKTSADLSASGKNVIVPAGYYATQASGSVASGSATAPASISGSSASVATGTNTLTLSKTVSVTPSVSAGYVSSGTAGNSSVSLTASVAVKDTDTITPTTSDQTIAAGTYIKGKQTIKGDANLVSSNIASGVSIFGVSGSHQSGTDTSDATAVAGDILSGKTAYVNGSKVTGTIATKTSSNLTASGKTVTVPAGYYASQYTKDVATGSATAPASISGSSATVSTGTNTLTLSKTVSVTPSVSAGYVSSGTAGNSSVSLTASVTTKAAATYNTSASDQTIGSGQYLTGTQTIKAVKVTNLTAENIRSGVTVQVGDADSAGRIASVEGSCKAVDDITSQFTFAKTYRINYVTGARQSGDSATECASSVVNIEGYKYLIISRRCIQDYSGPSGLAFYSGSNRTGYISGLRDIPVTAVNTDVSAVTRIAIPTGAKYVCTTWWKAGTEQASSASFICLGET